MTEKPLVWVGSAKEDLRAFPEQARRRAGYELHQVEIGLAPSDWKPLRQSWPSGRVAMAEFTHSSGNVFEDLGFSREEAENLKVRSVLMGSIRRVIESEGITQTEAAERFGVTQPRISDLVRGKIELFSIDALINMLATAGHHVEISVSSGGERAA